MSSPQIHVYTRPGCHLCEELIDALLPAVRDRAAVDVRNIDTREDWKLEYGLRIPVVEVDGQYVCQYRLDLAAVQEALAAGRSTLPTS